MNKFSVALYLLMLCSTVTAQSEDFVCPVTVASEDKSLWYDEYRAHHNEVLAVHLYDNGTRVLGQSGAWRQDDGYIHCKYPWYKKVAGKLRLTGERLDAKSDRPFIDRTYDPYSNAGEIPGGFLLPNTGCWKITGHLAGEELSFVLNILETE